MAHAAAVTMRPDLVCGWYGETPLGLGLAVPVNTDSESVALARGRGWDPLTVQYIDHKSLPNEQRM